VVEAETAARFWQQLIRKQHGVQGFLPGFDHVKCSAWGGGGHS
jgi:hypothetical protein